jgi:guanine deaminase
MWWDWAGSKSIAARFFCNEEPLMSPKAFSVIRHGTVLVDAGSSPRQADLLIQGDEIVGLIRPGGPVPDGAQVISAAGQMLMPGLVNGHTHAHGALAKGLVDDGWYLELFLNANPALTAGRSIRHKYVSAQLSAAAMIRSGCTACFDMFVEVPEPSVEGIYSVAQAYWDVGMRAIIAPMLADCTFYQALPGLLDALPDGLRAKAETIKAASAKQSLAVCRRAFHQWPWDRERVRPAIAPTIPLHCSDDFLKSCHQVANDYDLRLQTHLAESKVQASVGMRKYGHTLTAHLSSIGLIDERFSAAHAVWLDEDDIERIVESGGSIVHTPLSNLRMGSGVAPVREFLSSGIAVAIGTDGSNTSDSSSVFEASRLAAYLSRIRGDDTGSWISAREVLRMATIQGAQLLGWEKSIGRIAEGYKADLLFLDLDCLHFVPLVDPINQIVFSESGSSVRSVMIGGRLILEDGKLTTIDEAALIAEARAAAIEMAERSSESRRLARALERHVAAFCAGHRRQHYHVDRFMGV